MWVWKKWNDKPVRLNWICTFNLSDVTGNFFVPSFAVWKRVNFRKFLFCLEAWSTTCWYCSDRYIVASVWVSRKMTALWCIETVYRKRRDILFSYERQHTALKLYFHSCLICPHRRCEKSFYHSTHKKGYIPIFCMVSGDNFRIITICLLHSSSFINFYSFLWRRIFLNIKNERSTCIFRKNHRTMRENASKHLIFCGMVARYGWNRIEHENNWIILNK